ncbi:bacteriohemerythrin [Variovorax sp. Sphag1AA]|uniref:bacteriohemerythrin n=1 Tax=Variovorax sp. Sphag1AA TaxID=2587027 RepID=UPI00160E93EE|nr:hemerythrin domain-containing protein [Variovorax sp. Sphag1AA]MBB3181935.1 hemerythrin [Variovorax sp. Sphag1AA]
MNVAIDFAWDDRYLVGHQAMDDTHHEFVELVDAMLGAGDDAFASILERFAVHVEAHFATEQRLMDQFGYPVRDCHVEEHERVLASVREVRALVADGDIETGRDLARALADWFPGHTDYMDSALSTWITKKVANGAPVVLRRSMRHA